VRWLAAAALAFCTSALALSNAVALKELPAEARQTLLLIRAGGPFPFAQDGKTFQNREQLLPRHERGYYREYTVKTPGAKDRGARRIVAGRGGEYYYTSDHYRSFRRIIE
jgi:ribonuclease T1